MACCEEAFKQAPSANTVWLVSDIEIEISKCQYSREHVSRLIYEQFSCSSEMILTKISGKVLTYAVETKKNLLKRVQAGKYR